MSHVPRVNLDEFVLSALAKACGGEPGSIRPESCVLDLGIDSVKMVALVGQVESVFGLRFSTEDILEFFIAERVSDLIAVMKR